MAKRGLGNDGGFVYRRGGYRNLAGLKPADADPAVQAIPGDDDHRHLAVRKRARGFARKRRSQLDHSLPRSIARLTLFDLGRLEGRIAPLPRDYAVVPDEIARTIPQFHNEGCAALGIIPEDVARGVVERIPKDFDPRPSTDPTLPAAATKRR